MSRAFVKESDDDLTAGELPERPLSDHTNYVTPRGLALLEARLKELQRERDALKVEERLLANQELREVKRDLRYYEAQLERAQLVDPAGQPEDEVRFGASVKVIDEDGSTQIFHIVGDDEADVAAGLISWATPLAKAMLGARVGDTVKWRRPAGTRELEVLEIRYHPTQSRR